MPLGPVEFDFGSSVIQDAMAKIKSRGLNKLYCSLTGAEYATLSNSEIELSLRVELQRVPLIDVDQLVNAFVLRHAALSSGPCPSLRVHKDHSTLLYLLKSSEQGPTRLICYLTGRLFFEALTAEKEINSLSNRMAKLAFMRKMQVRLANLPKDWSQSLSAADELDNAAAKAVGILHIVGGQQMSPIEEGKAAQSSLEILTRIEAIHNIRHKFYSHKLRTDLLAFRDSEQFDFFQLNSLLNTLEQDAIIRLSQQRTQPMGNAMAITVALEALNWTRKRHGSARDTYMESIEKGIKDGKFGTGTISSVQVVAIKDLVDKPSLSKKDKMDLESVLKDLKRNVESVTSGDKRLEKLRTHYEHAGRSNETRGKLKVSPATALKHVAEAYLDNGQAIPESIKNRIKQLKKAGKAVKPESKEQVISRRTKSENRKARINRLKAKLNFKESFNLKEESE